MLDIVQLSSSALTASTGAMKNISSNLANMNTAGFRASRTTFANMFDAGSESGDRAANGGVALTKPILNMKPGSYVNTGNSMDVAVLGSSFFVLKDSDGKLHYTRNGQFEMKDNKLVARDGSTVQALGAGGLEDFSIASALTSAGVATSSVKFKSGFSILQANPTTSTTPNAPPTPYTVDVTVYDANGGAHKLTLKFTPKTDINPPDPTSSKQWDVAVLENGQDIGSPTPAFVLKFDLSGRPVVGSNEFTFTYKPSGLAAVDVKVSCDEIRSQSAGASSLSPDVDGRASGTLDTNSLTFDEKGELQLTYTNTEKGKGPKLALAMTSQDDDWEQDGSGLFKVKESGHVQYGTAGDLFGKISPRQLEGSNVDMSQEFSDLIVAQRMYSSATQVIQTTGTLADALLRAVGGR